MAKLFDVEVKLEEADRSLAGALRILKMVADVTGASAGSVSTKPEDIRIMRAVGGKLRTWERTIERAREDLGSVHKDVMEAARRE